MENHMSTANDSRKYYVLRLKLNLFVANVGGSLPVGGWSYKNQTCIIIVRTILNMEVLRWIYFCFSFYFFLFFVNRCLSVSFMQLWYSDMNHIWSELQPRLVTPHEKHMYLVGLGIECDIQLSVQHLSGLEYLFCTLYTSV